MVLATGAGREHVHVAQSLILALLKFSGSDSGSESMADYCQYFIHELSSTKNNSAYMAVLYLSGR